LTHSFVRRKILSGCDGHPRRTGLPSRPKSGGARDQARVEAGRAAERASARAPSPGRGNSGIFKRPLGETPLPKKTRGLPKKTEPRLIGERGLPKKTRPLPKKTRGLPKKTRGLPNKTRGLPKKTEPRPIGERGLPKKTGPLPKKTRGLPEKTEASPKWTRGLPKRPDGCPKTRRPPPKPPPLPSRGRRMPARKLRDLQEMEDSLWREPGDPKLWRCHRSRVELRGTERPPAFSTRRRSAFALRTSSPKALLGDTVAGAGGGERELARASITEPERRRGPYDPTGELLWLRAAARPRRGGFQRAHRQASGRRQRVSEPFLTSTCSWRCSMPVTHHPALGGSGCRAGASRSVVSCR
jgi:hypothetical protein